MKRKLLSFLLPLLIKAVGKFLSKRAAKGGKPTGMEGLLKMIGGSQGAPGGKGGAADLEKLLGMMGGAQRRGAPRSSSKGVIDVEPVRGKKPYNH